MDLKKYVKANPNAKIGFASKNCPACDRCNDFGKVADKIVDGDQNMNLLKEYGIEYYPTIVIFKNGKEKERIIGCDVKKLKKLRGKRP